TVLAVFNQPDGIVDAEMRHDRITDAEGGKFTVESRFDGFGGEFGYDQVLRWRAGGDGGLYGFSQLMRGVKQAGQRRIVALVLAHKNREADGSDGSVDFVGAVNVEIIEF